MRLSRKSNRVSWASGPHLCQVKLFVSENSPSKVCVPAKEHLIRKPSKIFEHSKGRKANDLPPGFESILKLRKVNQEALQIPKIEWSCPPSFVMRSEWCVVAGEESKEISAQKLREKGVLEAMYPHRLSIPHSPYISSGIGAEHWDDSLTPVVPLIPMEEEEEDAADLEPYLGDPSNPPVSSLTSQPTQKPNSSYIHDPVSEPLFTQNSALTYSGADLVTAASTALAVLVKSTEQTGLIDTDLLVKIFSDPEMIQNLINSSPTAVATTPPTAASKPDLIPPDCATPIPATSPTAVPSWTKPALNPGMTSISASVSLPAISSPSPLPPGGSSQFLHGGMKLNLPTYSVPVPLVSMPTRHVFENFTKPSMVQPGLVNVPPQPSIAPRSSPFTMRPNAAPNHQPPFSNGSRSQPNNCVVNAPWEAAKTDTVKDMNYIKNLIREHGTDKQQKQQFGTHNLVLQNMELTHNLRPEVEPKFQKPCAYFPKPSGCRKGSNCPFKHDTTPVQWQTGNIVGVPSAKRMKFGGVIEGR